MSSRARVPRRMVGLWLVLPALLLCAPVSAHAGGSNTIMTFAGLGIAGMGGDGGPANGAYLNGSGGMTQLADGSILLADSSNHRIRRISPAGIITTIVGTGYAGSSGDGGPASQARLNFPNDVAVAPDGASFYIAETYGHRIRLVDANGTITTVAGTGSAGYSGDFGPAGSAQLNNPYGVGVAPNGDLYIADYSNQRVRKVVATGGLVGAASTIQTFAGNGTAGYSGDNGPATLAQLNGPWDVLPLPGGDVAISDYSNARIREVDPFGVIRTVVGACSGPTYLCGDGGPAVLGGIYNPRGLAGDGAGGYLIADFSNYRVRHVSAAGVISTVIGTGVDCDGRALCGDGGPAENALIRRPVGVLKTADGAILVSDEASRVRARVSDPEQTGPAGPGGASGAAGAAGSAGNAGASGSSGSAGAQGPAGSTGTGGATGAVGALGVAGQQGSRGAAGPRGARGAAGRPSSLYVSFLAPVTRVNVRGRVRLRLFLGSRATLVVRVIRRGRVVRTVRVARARAGLKTISVRRLRRGTYRLTVTASSASAVSIDRATLRVR